MTSPPAARLMSENGGCTEPTWPRASQRSSMSTVKFDAPPARILPSAWRSSSAPHASSTGVPSSGGQWICSRSIRSAPRRRREASHSRRIDSGRPTRSGTAKRSPSSQTRPHLVNTSGGSARGERGDRPPDDLLGVAEAVGGGGFDPVDAELDGVMDRGDRVVVVLAAPTGRPLAADRPGADADGRDVHAGAAELPGGEGH